MSISKWLLVVMVVIMLAAISRCTLTAPGGDDGGARSLSTPSTSRRAHPLLPPLCTLLQIKTSHFSLWFLQNSIANIFIILFHLLAYFSVIACRKKKAGDPNLTRDTPGYPVLWRCWSEPNPLSLIQSRLFEPACPLGWFFSSVQTWSTFKSTLPWNQLRAVFLPGLFAAPRGDYSKQMGLGQFVGARAVLVGLGVSLSKDKAASTRGPFLTNTTLVTSNPAVKILLDVAFIISSSAKSPLVNNVDDLQKKKLCDDEILWQ